MSEPIQFRVTKHMLIRTRKPSSYCPHNAMQLNVEERTVTCTTCNEELDPYEALRILAQRTWWEENARERALEQEEKRVRKVQTAAVEHLYAAGVTPEK